LKLAEKEARFRVIDGTLNIEEIHNRIIKEIILLEKRSTHDKR
jgi:thymidylate kinase